MTNYFKFVTELTIYLQLYEDGTYDLLQDTSIGGKYFIGLGSVLTNAQVMLTTLFLKFICWGGLKKLENVVS